MLSKFKKINVDLLIKVSLLVATVECTYLFFFGSLLPLLLPASTSIIGYASSSCLQLVLLPLILFSQRMTSESLDAKHAENNERHDDTAESLSIIYKILKETEDETALLLTIAAGQQSILDNQHMFLENQQTILASLSKLEATK